jgi:hypothetical protein
MQAVNIMAFSVEKCVFLVEHYLETELFRTIQSDYSHQFRCPVPEQFVIWKFMKQFGRTGNVNIPKCVHRLAVIQAQITADSDILGENPHKSLQKLALQTGMLYSVSQVKTFQLFPRRVMVIKQLLPLDCKKQHQYHERLLAKVEDDPPKCQTLFFYQIRHGSVLQIM